MYLVLHHKIGTSTFFPLQKISFFWEIDGKYMGNFPKIFPNQNWKFFGSLFFYRKQKSISRNLSTEFPEAKCQEPSPSVSVLENG